MTFSDWHLFRFIAVVVLATALLVPTMPPWAEVSALVVLVAATGLPHGAFDPYIAKRRGVWKSGSSLIVFSFLYLALAGIVVGLWVIAPVLSLGLFLAASAWHFGGDWSARILPRLAFGGLILALPAVLAPTEVAYIFVVLSGESALALVQGLSATSLCAATFLLVEMIRQNSSGEVLARLPDLAILITTAALLPPTIYFIVYFCALHSPMHMRETLIGFRNAERRSAIQVAFVFTLLTLALGLCAFAIMPSTTSISDAAVQIIFIGLAALTVPHLVLIDGFRQREWDSVK